MEFADSPPPYPEVLNCKECPHKETVQDFSECSPFDTITGFTYFKFIESEYFTYSEDEVSCSELKGWKGEVGFCEWLNHNNLPFVFFEQGIDTFSHVFKDQIKRPDVLLLIEGIGTIAVDVKNYSQFTLGIKKESSRYLEFQELFNIPVWYAYSNTEGNFDSWLWISAINADKKGKVIGNNKHLEYLKIPPEHFKKIQTKAELNAFIKANTPLKKS
ncbi:hypothetical protein [Colwellia sp. Arc7-D]|uniref:hypothetical protein n=1 Tax=Colwellia sp. Arc7-D TaxID=2161872 RepID=UPI0013A58EB8|nr:hypothetical protein [Colwellia sp. Arc7-D]